MVNGDEFKNIDTKASMENPSPHANDADRSISSDAAKRDFDNNISEDNRNLSKVTPGGSVLPAGAYIGDLERQRDSSGYASESGDMLRELVKNKELMEMSGKKTLKKIGSVDSDISDSSIMVC